MAAGWMPQEEATAKICGLFSEYQHPGSNQAQVGASAARSALDELVHVSLGCLAADCTVPSRCARAVARSFCEVTEM